MSNIIGIARLRRASVGLVVVAGALVAAGEPLAAQQRDSVADTLRLVTQQGAAAQQATLRPPVPTLFTRRDAAIAGLFALGTAAMMPVDRHFARELQNPDVQANKVLGRIADGVEGIASPGAYLIGGALFVVGRAGGQLSDARGFDRMARLGWHGLEAVMLSEGIGYVLKGAIGRARPYVSGATRSQDWKLGSGFGTTDRRSFPSGHTYTAFSAASVVAAEMHEWWPGSTWIVAPVMYGGATMVGVSRMYHNKHWASDIVLGAAIGTFSGLKVVRHAQRHPDNFLDRIALGASIVPTSRGAGLMWQANTPF